MKNKKGEIGTIVMMALLVIVSIIGFSSQKFLSSKKTTSTQAAANRLCCLKYGCGLYGASAGQRKVTAIGFEGVNAQGTAGYTSCLNTGYTGSFYCDSLSGAPTTNGTSTYVTSADCTTSSTPTPVPTTPSTCACPHSCQPGVGGCWWGSGGPYLCSSKCCSDGACPSSTAATPTPTRTPTPTIVNTPLPTSSGKICAIFTLDYKCYGIGKIFHPSQIVSVCPKNSSCWGIDTSSCDQTFEEVQKYFCSDQPPTPTGPTVTTNPNLPTPTLTKTPSPTLPQVSGNNQVCVDRFKTAYTYCGNYFGSTFSCTKTDNVRGNILKYVSYNYVCGIGTLNKDLYCCVREDADTSPNLTNQTLPTPLQGSPDQICKAALNTELTYCQFLSGCFKQDAVNGKAISYHESSARCDNNGNERKCCVRDDVCTNCHNVSFTYTTEAQTVTTDTGQQGQFINLPEEGTVFFGP